MEREDFLLQLAEQGIELIYPDPLKDYRRFLRFKIPTYSGGLMNQPHIQMMEWDTCESALAEHENIRVVNAIAKQNRQPSIGGE